MIGAVSAASDGNVTAAVSDSADNSITQHFDAVADNSSESITDNNLKGENALKMEADAPDSVLKGSGTTEVNNWA